MELTQSDFYLDLINVPPGDAPREFPRLDTPLWTQNKALLIAQYMKSFTYVTRHGTYIDAFAGPQHEDTESNTWAVKLVLENDPAWLRNFHLFDIENKQVEQLEKLKKDHFEKHPDLSKTRKINIFLGDSNDILPKFLSEHPIRDREAAFCLLDQRSTECAWDTVKVVAEHKNRLGAHKIEIFYFLAQAWIHRAIMSWRTNQEQRCLRWWGREDIMNFLRLKSFERGVHFANRFKSELGYRFAFPYPIQKKGEQGVLMFWMIHASDHERAPDLMNQAYRKIGAGGGLHESIVQEELDLGL